MKKIILTILVSFLSFLTFKYWLNNKSSGIESAELEVLKYSQILKISIPLMFAQSVQFIMAWTDKLMIGNMMDAESVAIYGIAFRFSMIVSITLMAINSIAAPKFACLLYTSPSPRDGLLSRMPSSA